jgi:hypothetical protein
MLRDNNIRYFDPERIVGGKLHQNYETGSSIYEDVYNKKLPYKCIDYNDYLYHHCGSSHVEDNEYIQPNLFFIWFGNNKPDYVDFAVNAFKEVNPDFNIQLIEYTIDEIEYICDIPHGKMEKTIKYSHDWLLNNSFHYVAQNFLNNPSWKRPHFTQTLLNNYKWWLINYFGGIYLDCDTFPIRPFDYTLLYNNKIESLETDRYSICKFTPYMIGCIKGRSSYSTKYIQPIISGEEYPLEYRKKFYECKLEYGDHYNNIETCYVDHFSDKRWCYENLRTFKCKYDKYIT